MNVHYTRGKLLLQHYRRYGAGGVLHASKAANASATYEYPHSSNWVRKSTRKRKAQIREALDLKKIYN